MYIFSQSFCALKETENSRINQRIICVWNLNELGDFIRYKCYRTRAYIRCSANVSRYFAWNEAV